MATPNRPGGAQSRHVLEVTAEVASTREQDPAFTLPAGAGAGGADGTAVLARADAAWRDRRTYPTRYYHAMAYDRARGVIVLFGGSDGSPKDDVWEWNGSSWTGPLRPATRPSPRYGHAMAFDSARGVVVLFGGTTATTYLDDVWEWDGTSWAGPFTPTARPGARMNHSMTYDSARGVAVLFGGFNGITGGARDDVWEWNGTTWAGPFTPASRPSARTRHALAYDSVRNRIVLFGGRYGVTRLDEVWEWNGVSWVGPFTPPSRPSGREQHAMAYDSSRRVVVLFGGNDGAIKDDVWEWNGSTWTGPLTPPNRPSGRDLHAMVYDSSRGRVVVFGGDSGSTAWSDVWEWEGAAS